MTEPKKVYLVTKGCYSDYKVHLVFSTKEGAEKYIEKISPEERESENVHIEEFTLDIKKEQPFSGLLLMMELESGEVKGILPSLFNFYYPYDDDYYDKFDPSLRVYLNNKVLKPHFSMSFDHTDKERAVKVMSEKRAALIATYGSIENLKAGRYHRDNLNYIGLR